jgi:hypothetical protein
MAQEFGTQMRRNYYLPKIVNENDHQHFVPKQTPFCLDLEIW